MTKQLQDYLEIWRQKPGLRAIYQDFYDRMAPVCARGLTLEIGGGIGNLKQRIPDLIATDIQFAPWLDCVADAHSLPFAANAFANIVMVDVLHHIQYSTIFFAEAERVLRPGGRIIMVEPAITFGSSLFYHYLHHEETRMSANPLVEGTADPARDPYESNQAIPTLLATRESDEFHRQFPNLRISRVDWFSFLAYPLSGGFKSWSLLSAGIVRHVLRAERAVESVFARWVGFRMMIVIEKATEITRDC
jgi:SAM-dependent methyltransferase